MASEKRKSAIPLDIVDGKSPANQYLLRLLEDKGTISFQQPTEERIQLVFDVLDKVTPQLGVFSRVLRLIRAEIYDAVYRPPLTGRPVWKHSEGLITQVPYFSLVRRMQDERNEEVEKVTSELHSVKTILFLREEEVRCVQKNICALQETNRTLQVAITALQSEAKDSGIKIKKLQEEIGVHANLLAAKTQEHTASMAHVQRQQSTAQDLTDQLGHLKRAYETLHNAFQSPLVRKKQNMLSPISKVPAGRMALSSAHQAHVRSYLQTTVHMYQQLLQVQNRVMDDFDSFLENQIHVSTGGEISQQQQQQQQQQQKELEKKKKHFLDCMAEISTELSLLGQQRESLEQQDTGPSKEDPLTSQILSSQNPPLSSQNRPLSSTESQEKMTEDESLEDFFSLALYPSETLLNRYAAMIYTTTDNGRIYEEIAGASMCNSCGEKTFLCPHKVGGTQVTDLPKHCTHIKICRPHAHRFTMAAKLAGSRMSDHAEKTGAGMALSRAVSPGPYIPARAGTALAQQALGDNPSQSVPSLSSWQGSWAPVDLSRLEKHFEKQFKHKREAPRKMSLDLCLSLTEQLMTNLLCHRKSKSTQVLSIQDTLWDLLTQRYVADNISALGLQDFLAAVWKYSAVSKVVSVLGQVLRGDMDPAILHYVLLQAELLNLLPLTAPSHLHLVIEQNYPFLEETEQDSLVLEFTAYSERCVSSACVMAFILHLILQHNEPFILECEDKLLPYLKTQTDFLTYEELSVALDELAPGNCTEEKHSLIQQSLVSLSSTLIPIQHAAQIVAYLTKSGERQKRKEQLHIAIAMDKGNAESKRTKGPESMAHVCDLRFLSNVLHLAKITRTFTD